MSFSTNNIHSNYNMDTKKTCNQQVDNDGCIFRSAVYHEGVSLKKSVTRVQNRACVNQAEKYQANKATQPISNSKLAVHERWSASSMHMKNLPFYHSLDNHHRFFEQSELESVVIRLQDMFQTSSLCVEYNNGNEARSAFAECTALENVEFAVVFWARDGKFLAEVQRTKGDSHHYYQYAQQVLDAIDGNKRLLDLKPNDPLDVDVMDYESEQQCMQTVFSRCVPALQGLPTIEDDIKNAIELIASMVSTNRYDSLRTGLESLKSMTDVRTSGCQVAKAAAAAVLNNTTIITQTVTSFAAGVNIGNSHFKDFEFCALTILGQSVNLVDDQVLAEFVRLYPGVIQSLLFGAVQANAHIAYLSTHILALLHAHVAEVAELPVKHMQLVGATSHAALAYACERLMRGIAVNEQFV